LHAPGIEPYRASLAVQLFVTSERVHGHEIRWDVQAAGHPRLRLFGRAGYFATVNRNYCGVGNAVTCDAAVAEAAAVEAGLEPGSEEADDFARRYYRRRFIDPFVIAGARLGLGGSDRLSAFAVWRVSLYREGTL